MDSEKAASEVRLVDDSWMQELHDGLARDPSGFRIICPFIKDAVLKELLTQHNPEGLRVITRFRLADFVDGVSDIGALRRVIQAGGTVRGVRGLHAKMFLFGHSRAAVTSANLTARGMHTNHEFGCVSEDSSFVTACASYFNKLWDAAGDDLQMGRLDEWQASLNGLLDTGSPPYERLKLPDHGVAVPGISTSEPDEPVTSEGWPGDSGQYFVKFFGQGSNRAVRSLPVLEEVKRSGCHWACTYPSGKRPRAVQDGDTLFLARLAKDPDDTLIFGRAIARAYRDGLDDATPAEIDVRPWKKTWPHYVRVHHAEFVAGDIGNGVSLKELMEALGPDSFTSTRANAAAGHGNVDPRLAFRQQASVRLTAEAASWLTARLEHDFAEHGRIPPGELNELDWPKA